MMHHFALHTQLLTNWKKKVISLETSYYVTKIDFEKRLENFHSASPLEKFSKPKEKTIAEPSIWKAFMGELSKTS